MDKRTGLIGAVRIMVDETSASRGQRHVTVILDADSHDLLLMVDGSSGDAIEEFARERLNHGTSPAQITEGVMDMTTSFISGAKRTFPQARIAFDLFHIMKLTGEALDVVNGILQPAKRMAKGFTSFRYYRIAAYVRNGRLNIATPHDLPI